MNPNEITNTDRFGPLISEYIIDSSREPSPEKRVNLQLTVNGVMSVIRFPKFDFNVGDVFERRGFLFKFIPVVPGVIRLHIFGRPELQNRSTWARLKKSFKSIF